MTRAPWLAALFAAGAARAEPAVRTEGIHLQVQVGQAGLVDLHVSPDGERALSVGASRTCIRHRRGSWVKRWSARGDPHAWTTPVADTDGNGFVSTDELRVYVARAVAERSGDRQHPTADRDNDHLRIELPIVPP